MDNNVILLGYYGGDESHCLSAWQSTNIELNIDLSDDISKRINQLFQETVKHKKKSACEQLTKVLGRKRAKESARYFLPYSKQIDFDMMFNFRSFVHFQKLRNSEHAQKEVREIAQKMLELIKQIDNFKYSLEAFNL